MVDFLTLQIARVVPREKLEVEESGADISNLLLLHGTKKENVKGTLQKNFIPSLKGKFGPGVYHTDSCIYAALYSNKTRVVSC